MEKHNSITFRAICEGYIYPLAPLKHPSASAHTPCKQSPLHMTSVISLNTPILLMTNVQNVRDNPPIIKFKKTTDMIYSLIPFAGSTGPLILC